MSEVRSGISRTMFVVGLIVGILASSLIASAVSMQYAKGLQGDKGDTEATGATWLRGTPVQFTGSLQLADGNLANGMTYFFVVPNETRLVIEFVSARINNLDPSDSIDLHIVTWVNGTRVEHYLGVAGPEGRPEIDPYSQAYQFISQEVRIYADAGSHVSVGANRVTRINTATVVFSISGYLVDVP